MGENVEACLKRISVCAKSCPVGLAFCALMICECFWGTNRLSEIFSHESRVRDRCEWEGVQGGASVYRTRPTCTEKQGCKLCNSGRLAGLRLFRIFADGWKTMAS